MMIGKSSWEKRIQFFLLSIAMTTLVFASESNIVIESDNIDTKRTGSQVAKTYRGNVSLAGNGFSLTADNVTTYQDKGVDNIRSIEAAGDARMETALLIITSDTLRLITRGESSQMEKVSAYCTNAKAIDCVMITSNRVALEGSAKSLEFSNDQKLLQVKQGKLRVGDRSVGGDSIRVELCRALVNGIRFQEIAGACN